MVVIYDSLLTEPPSSVYCFRDVTLYVDVFLQKDNLLLCQKGTRSMYWRWIKQYGAHDFIKDILTIEEKENGIYVGSRRDVDVNVLNEKNYGNVINVLKSRFIF